MLRQFTREDKADSSLNLARRDGSLLRVLSEARGFLSDTFEDVIDKGVEDSHRLVRDTRVGVDLLEDLVDVGGVSLLADLSPLLGLLVASSTSRRGSGLLASGGLLSDLLSRLNWSLAGSGGGLVACNL